MQSADSIASNGGVLTKIYVPPQIFAISSALAGLTNFFIGMVPLALVCFISGQALAWTLPLVLVVGVALALLTAGFGLALSIMFIRFDDTRNIVNVLLMILMYLTPIFYPVSVMNSTMQRIIHWNPLTSYLEIFRWAFSNNASPTMFNWLYMGFWSIFALALGTFVFRKFWPRTVAML
jgi:ABC-type polysaccharide/polyol phosphate export permease